MSIKELENKCLKPILYSVYGNELCGDTLQDLLSNMVAYINECISQTNDNTILVNKLNDWIRNQGLKEEVIKQLNVMVDNGTFDTIINQQVFGDLDDNIKIVDSKTIVNTQEINKMKTKVNNDKNELMNIINKNKSNMDKVFVNLADYNVINDGSVDVTQELQNVLDNLKDNSTLVIPEGTYWVSKLPHRVEFPHNDEPCLFLNQKRNIDIIGLNCTFVVKKHGQGILELQKCSNINITGITTKGYGEYPSLEGTTGRGEKARNISIWNLAKNNNTESTHFGGGYEGNGGVGILIQNGCNNVNIKDCNSYGFNYAGICLGWLNDRLYPKCNNINITNCVNHNMYNSGITLVYGDNITIDDNVVKDIGHPQALITDETCDPGYGITSTGYDVKPTNIIIRNNVVYNCKRKGIDNHNGDDFKILNNIVENCYVTGIYGAYSSATQPSKNLKIKNNILRKCGIKQQSEGGIYVQGLIDGEDNTSVIDCVIQDNILEECGGSNGIISSRRFSNLIVKGNTIKNCALSGLIGIYLGRKSTKKSYNIDCSDNIINDNKGIVYGIRVGSVEGGIVQSNSISLKYSGIKVNGLYDEDTTDVLFTNNSCSIGNNGFGFNLSKNPQNCYGNTSNGGSENSYMDSQGNKIITFTVTFNGTATPTFNNVALANKYISELKSTTNGFSFKYLNNKKYSYAIVNLDLGGSGISEVGYTYVRGIQNELIEIGLKDSISGTHKPASSLSSGTIRVSMII